MLGTVLVEKQYYLYKFFWNITALFLQGKVSLFFLVLIFVLNIKFAEFLKVAIVLNHIAWRNSNQQMRRIVIIVAIWTWTQISKQNWQYSVIAYCYLQKETHCLNISIDRIKTSGHRKNVQYEIGLFIQLNKLEL